MLTQQQLEVARQLRSHYDKQKLLGNGLVLHNALGDILGVDNQKLRTQIRLAMDAGLGKQYLELGDAVPDADFDRKVKTLLEEECGLSSSIATDVQAFFDELAGVPPRPVPVASPMPATLPKPIVSPEPIASPVPKTATVSSMPSLSWGKLYFWAVLPFIVNVVYSMIDRMMMGWIGNIASNVAYSSWPKSISEMFTVPHCERLIIPLVLPYVLPLLLWLVLALAGRGKEIPRAVMLATRYGVLCAIMSLVLGNVLAPMSITGLSAFTQFLLKHYSILSFNFRGDLGYLRFLRFGLPYIIPSLVLPALAVLLILLTGKRSRT